MRENRRVLLRPRRGCHFLYIFVITAIFCIFIFIFSWLRVKEKSMLLFVLIMLRLCGSKGTWHVMMSSCRPSLFSPSSHAPPFPPAAHATAAPLACDVWAASWRSRRAGGRRSHFSRKRFVWLYLSLDILIDCNYKYIYVGVAEKLLMCRYIH